MHRLLRIDVFFSDDIHIVKDLVVPDVRLGAFHGRLFSNRPLSVVRRYGFDKGIKAAVSPVKWKG